MPCPVFSPTRVVDDPLYRGGRLPLIDEYEGICTAQHESPGPNRETLFRFCNHGYSQGHCPRFPASEDTSCVRYSIASRTAYSLEVICVEEAHHEPQRWHKFEYLLDRSEMRGNIPTECIRAQAVA